MSLSISGKLVEIGQVITGGSAERTWTKREFVIETFGTYPKKVCFHLWNNKVSLLDGFSVGQSMTVDFDVESRAYKDRWYTELKAWRMVAGEQMEQPPMMGNFDSQDFDQSPF